jgi:hypothetical protein
MPSLKSFANFEIQFMWILSTEEAVTVFRVHVRVVFHGTAWGVGSIIKNQSVSQSITSYNALRQRLLDRFPMQHGSNFTAGLHSDAQDVCFALAMARQAAQRMPAGSFCFSYTSLCLSSHGLEFFDC